MPSDPQRYETLVHLAHLPGTGDHAAAVDHTPNAVQIDVLSDQQLRTQLCRAVEGTRAAERKCLREPPRGRPRHLLLVGELEASGGLAVLETVDQPDRVHAAGREEDEVGTTSASDL